MTPCITRLHWRRIWDFLTYLMGHSSSLFNLDDEDDKEESLNNMRQRLFYLKLKLVLWSISGNGKVIKPGRIWRYYQALSWYYKTYSALHHGIILPMTYGWVHFWYWQGDSTDVGVAPGAEEVNNTIYYLVKFCIITNLLKSKCLC